MLFRQQPEVGMRKWLVVCAVLAAGAAQAAEADPEAQLAQLGWLHGCWAAEGGEPGSLEQWMAPAGGTMLGMSRTVKGGKTVEHEFLQLRAVDGKLAYVAHPSGQAPAAFPLRSLAADEAVFENPAHDFPQRIIYRRLGQDGLRARIEGTRNGAPRGRDFPMKRVACEATMPS
jgi:hypothetical protein